MQVSTFDLPLFPGYQGRENVSAPMLPEQVDSFLNKFNSVAGILGFLEWPLCNFRWCSPEKHVVRGYVATVIWSFGTLPICCWLKGFATSRNTVFNSNGVRSWLQWPSLGHSFMFNQYFCTAILIGSSGCHKRPVHAFLCTKLLNLQLIQSTHHLTELFLSADELCTIICHHQRRLTSYGIICEELAGTPSLNSQLPFPNVLPLYSNKWTGRSNA